ncbi:MAG: hypothetical protein CM15mP13_3370 [Pseudomonadota bacterium]|nr:MAG: hypothetical protein CM15mP13_3370 [Pseudomonadota bacterium]
MEVFGLFMGLSRELLFFEEFNDNNQAETCLAGTIE